jgi:hypothetical protein
MKVRSLLIRLDSDQLRLGRAWLEDAISDPKGKDRWGQAILDALRTVQDAGTLEGTPFHVDLEEPTAETAPVTAQEAPGAAKAPQADLPAPPAKAKA